MCMRPMGGDFLGVVISTALVLNTASSPNCSSNLVFDEQLIRGKLFFKGKGWKEKQLVSDSGWTDGLHSIREMRIVWRDTLVKL